MNLPDGWPEFKPCVVYNAEADHTEMILTDTCMFWTMYRDGVELAWEMETGALIGIRLPGRHDKLTLPREAL